MVKGAESGQTARLPLPWQTFIDEANASEVSSVEAEWLPFQPNKVVQENELPNQGLEVAMRGESERCLGLSLFRWMRYIPNQRNRSVCSVECKEISV